MKVNRLRLKNFRGYKTLDISFSDGLNVLVGKNAQGKTNLLEAILFAGIGKSFRTSKEKEVISWGETNSSIQGEVERLYRDVKIELFFNDKTKKAIKVDGISIHRIGELIGNINAIFFSPDELKLVKESPEERRRFMNIDISQTNKKYFYLLARYDKILASRNKLLKNSKELQTVKETVDIWDRALVDTAVKIVEERVKFVDELAPLANLAHSYISGGSEKLEIKYNQTKESLPLYAENLSKQLKKNIEKDYKLGYTSVGPHRDDLDIFLNGVEVKSYGSQGQQRTTALSLKLAELEIIKNRVGEYPILLLDDVFSELDAGRRKRLLKFTSRAQTIITCTDFEKEFDDATIFEVRQGQLFKQKV